MKIVFLIFVFVGFNAQAKEALSVDAAISKLQSSKKKKMQVSVKGEISSVCQAKGCWITLKPEGSASKATDVCEEALTSASTQADVRVMMGDHSFTVPKNLKGSVVVNGELKKKKLSSFQLKHLLKDSGCSETQMKKAKKALYKYQIVATKVVKGSTTYSAE